MIIERHKSVVITINLDSGQLLTSRQTGNNTWNHNEKLLSPIELGRLKYIIQHAALQWLPSIDPYLETATAESFGIRFINTEEKREHKLARSGPFGHRFSKDKSRSIAKPDIGEERLLTLIAYLTGASET